MKKKTNFVSQTTENSIINSSENLQCDTIMIHNTLIHSDDKNEMNLVSDNIVSRSESVMHDSDQNIKQSSDFCIDQLSTTNLSIPLSGNVTKSWADLLKKASPETAAPIAPVKPRDEKSTEFTRSASTPTMCTTDKIVDEPFHSEAFPAFTMRLYEKQSADWVEDLKFQFR